MVTEIYMQLAGVTLAIIYFGHLLKNVGLFLTPPSDSVKREHDDIRDTVAASKVPGTVVPSTRPKAAVATAAGDGHPVHLESTTKREPVDEEAEQRPTEPGTTARDQGEKESKPDISNAVALPWNLYAGHFGRDARRIGTEPVSERLISIGGTIDDCQQMIVEQLKSNFLRPAEGSHISGQHLPRFLLCRSAPEMNNQSERLLLQESPRRSHPAIMPRSASLKESAVNNQGMQRPPAVMQRSSSMKSPAVDIQNRRDSSLAIRPKSPFRRSGARSSLKVDRALLQRSLAIRSAGGDHRDVKIQPAIMKICSADNGQPEGEQDPRGSPPAIKQRSSSPKSPAVNDQAVAQPPAVSQKSSPPKSPAVSQQDQRDSSLAIRPKIPFLGSAARSLKRPDEGSRQDVKQQIAVRKSCIPERSHAADHQKPAIMLKTNYRRSTNHEVDKMSPSAGLTKPSLLRSSEESHHDQIIKPTPAIRPRTPCLGSAARSLQRSAGGSHPNKIKQQLAIMPNPSSARSQAAEHEESAVDHEQRDIVLKINNQRSSNHEVNNISPSDGLIKRAPLRSLDESCQDQTVKPMPAIRPRTALPMPSVVPAVEITPASLQRSSSLKLIDSRRQQTAALQRSSTIREPAVNPRDAKGQSGIVQRSVTVETRAIVHHDGTKEPSVTEDGSPKTSSAGSQQESSAVFQRSSHIKMPEVLQQDGRGSSLPIRTRSLFLRSAAKSLAGDSTDLGKSTSMKKEPAVVQRSSPIREPSSGSRQDVKQQPAFVLRSLTMKTPTANCQDARQQPAVVQSYSRLRPPAAGTHQDARQLPTVQTCPSKNSAAGNRQQPAILQRSSTLIHQDRKASSTAAMQRSSSLRSPALDHQQPVPGKASSLRSPEARWPGIQPTVALPASQSLLSPDRHRHGEPVQIVLPEPTIRNRKYVTWKPREAEEIGSVDRQSEITNTSTSTARDSSGICAAESCSWSARPPPESPRSHQKRMCVKRIRKFLKAIGQALSGKPATRTSG